MARETPAQRAKRLQQEQANKQTSEDAQKAPQKPNNKPNSHLQADAVGGLKGTDVGAARAALRKGLMSAMETGVDIAEYIKTSGLNINIGSIESEQVIPTIEEILEKGELPEDFVKDLPIVKNMAGGRPVPFKRHVIPNEDIEKLTVVSELNPRDKETLSRIDVEDIICTFEDDKGQDETQYAFGYWTTDEKGNRVIAVFDGSRRRLAHIIDGRHPYIIYVTDEVISEEDFAIFDKVTETKKPRSSVENGRYWLRLKSKLGFQTNSEVAAYLDTPVSTVNDCIRVASIDSKYLALAYEPSVIGRPLAEKIRKFDTELTDEQFKTLKKLRDEYLEENQAKFTDLAPVTINGRVIDFCLSEANKLLAGSETDAGGSTKPKAVPVIPLKNKNQKVTVKRNIGEKSSSIVYEIKNLPKKFRDELDADIEKLIKSRLEELKAEDNA
jgi:hypothetical protein